jgi:hypothetical protein
MTLPQHQILWTNIQQFAFDDRTATITFSKKLAVQQKWSLPYTQRVIEEYRRFIFLCCFSSNGASPSKAVDEVWHLHLTYTQSYWNAFCKNTLGKDIHHYPSSGGEQEVHKHVNWYEETLALYETVFGAAPPPDIWPQPVKQQQVTTPALSIPEQPYQVKKQLIIIAASLLILPFAINILFTGKVSPFSLNGPEFLSFYAILGLAALLAHYLLRSDRFLFMKKAANGVSFADTNIFQLTDVVYGKERALQTSLVDLYRRELVTVEDRKIVGHQNRYQAPAKEENPLIPALMINPDESWVYYSDVEDWYNRQSFKHPATEKLLRLTEENEARGKRYLAVLIALFIGLARILQGWLNDRPVTYLFMEVIALVVTAGLISYKFSANGLIQQRLKDLLLDKAGTRQLHADPVINDFAINGKRVLDWLPAAFMLESMFVIFPVVKTTDFDRSSSSSDSSGCGSSGGGSSCGSGGGCGGCSGSN